MATMARIGDVQFRAIALALFAGEAAKAGGQFRSGHSGLKLDISAPVAMARPDNCGNYFLACARTGDFFYQIQFTRWIRWHGDANLAAECEILHCAMGKHADTGIALAVAPSRT
jgi:hypothetical protein